MLFADPLEVVNSGRLPPALTVEKLRVAHQSCRRTQFLPCSPQSTSQVPASSIAFRYADRQYQNSNAPAGLKIACIVASE